MPGIPHHFCPFPFKVPFPSLDVKTTFVIFIKDKHSNTLSFSLLGQFLIKSEKVSVPSI